MQCDLITFSLLCLLLRALSSPFPQNLHRKYIITLFFCTVQNIFEHTVQWFGKGRKDHSQAIRRFCRFYISFCALFVLLVILLWALCDSLLSICTSPPCMSYLFLLFICLFVSSFFGWFAVGSIVRASWFAIVSLHASSTWYYYRYNYHNFHIWSLFVIIITYHLYHQYI